MRDPLPDPRAPGGRILATIGVAGCLLLAGTECRPGRKSGPSSGGPLEAVYLLDGRAVRLTAGRAEVEAAPGSAARTVTAVLGAPVFGDLDGEDGPDAALVLVQSSGGSGTFYFAAAYLRSGGTPGGTNAVLLGDRIGAVTLSISDRTILVRYDDRQPGEPMAAAPDAGRTVRLAVVSGELKKLPSGRS